MKSAPRNILTLASIGALAILLCLAFWQLPGFGKYPGPYGDLINSLAPYQRQIVNAVTAVMFDYRSLDTLGEEFILFAAVSGLVLLMREKSAERGDAPLQIQDQPVWPRSDAVQWTSLTFVGVIILFGIYMVLHGHLSPGGGFQGGAVVGTASVLVYLGNDYKVYRKTHPTVLLELGESIGAACYVFIGLGGLIAGGAFLQNFLPLGQRGHLLSAGTIPVINVAVGVEIAAGFALLFREFLKQTRARESDE